MHFPWWYLTTDRPDVDRRDFGGPRVGFALCRRRRTVPGRRDDHAYRTGNRDYLAYLKRHASSSSSYGRLRRDHGRGIWWTIGLASPLATQVLIRTFVFAWATEYVFFIVEIVSAFIFYYYWDRLPAEGPHDRSSGSTASRPGQAWSSSPRSRPSCSTRATGRPTMTSGARS